VSWRSTRRAHIVQYFFKERTDYQKVGTIHKHDWLDKPFAWDTGGYDLAVPTWDFIKVIPGQMTGRFEDVTTL